MKESALFEFNKKYYESNSINIIYKDLIKDNISTLFLKNTCILLYWPIDISKRFLLREGVTPSEGIWPSL